MSKSDDMRKLIDLANNNKMVSETYVTERDNESSPFKAFASWGNADILSESERVSVVYVDGIAGIKYTNAEDAKEAVALMKKKHPKKNFEIKQEMRESDDYSGNMKSLPKFHQVAGAPHRHRDDPDAYFNNPNRTDWSVPIVAGDVWERWNNPEMKVVIRGRVGGNGNIIISEPDDLDSTIMFAEGPFRKTYVKSKDTSIKLEGSVVSMNDNPATIKRLAKQWWNGDEQQYAKAQQTLKKMGWDIYEDEDDIILSKDGQQDYSFPMDDL